MASFDTTAPELENLTAELGVKGLPQFRFYQARRRQPPHCCRACDPATAAPGASRLLGCPALLPPPLRGLQGGQQVQDKIMGYKLSPLADAFKALDGSA